MSDDTVRMKVTVTGYYNAISEHYGEAAGDPHMMAMIDMKNCDEALEGPDMYAVCLFDEPGEVEIEPA